MSQASEPTDVLGPARRNPSRTSHLRAVSTGTVVGSGVRVLAVGAQSILSFASAHILGASGTGELFLGTAVAWIAAVVARLGLDNVVLRHIAIHRSNGNRAGMLGVARLGAAVVFCSASAATGIVFFLAPWIANDLFHAPGFTNGFRAVSFAIVPLALAFLMGEMLRGLERILQSQVVQGVLIPIGTTVGVLLLGSSYGSTGAAVAYVAGCTLAALVALVFWISATPELHGVKPEYDVRQMVRGARHQFPYHCLVMIMNWAPFVFLGIYASTRETGVFGIAWRLSLFVGIVPLALDAIAAPRIAALHAAGERSSLRWLSQTVTLALIAITLPVAATLAIFRGEVMSLFGAAFENGGVVLLPLVALRFLMTTMGPVNVTLIMTGHEKAIRNVLFIAAGFAVVGNAIFIRSHGAIGAAWASGGALALGSCLAAISVRRRLGFWPFPLSRTVVDDLLLFVRSGHYRSAR